MLNPDRFPMISSAGAEGVTPGRGRHRRGRHRSCSRRFTPGYAAMGAAKGGMEALTRQLAVELSPRNIRVNTVCGGLIATDTLEYFPDKERMIEFAIE